MPYKGKTNIQKAPQGITNLSKKGTQRPQSIPKAQTWKKR